MKEVVSILFCSLFISLHGMVLKAQDDNEAMARLMADPNRSSLSGTVYTNNTHLPRKLHLSI